VSRNYRVKTVIKNVHYLFHVFKANRMINLSTNKSSHYLVLCNNSKLSTRMPSPNAKLTQYLTFIESVTESNIAKMAVFSGNDHTVTSNPNILALILVPECINAKYLVKLRPVIVEISCKQHPGCPQIHRLISLRPHCMSVEA